VSGLIVDTEKVWFNKLMDQTYYKPPNGMMPTEMLLVYNQQDGYQLLELAQVVSPMFLIYMYGLETLLVAKMLKVLSVQELVITIKEK